MSNNISLPRDFFLQPTLDVAKNLLGKKIVYRNQVAIINETEAYIGRDDPACHAAKGRTPRTEPMFFIGGFSYVYLIYGMYHCLNVVTEEEGFPAAVLIRGVTIQNCSVKTDGPGKLTRALGVTLADNAVDLIHNENFYIADGEAPKRYITTPRIGISKGTELPWRFLSD